MSEFSKNLWAVFIVVICYGIWAIPIIMAAVAFYCLVMFRWPNGTGRRR